MLLFWIMSSAAYLMAPVTLESCSLQLKVDTTSLSRTSFRTASPKQSHTIQEGKLVNILAGHQRKDMGLGKRRKKRQGRTLDKKYFYTTTAPPTTTSETTTLGSAGPIIYPTTMFLTSPAFQMTDSPPSLNDTVIYYINETLCPDNANLFDCIGLNITENREDICFYFQNSQTINCEDARLEKVPNAIPSETKNMMLMGNHILKINTWTFPRFKSIVSLDLSYGWLHEVEGNTFTYMHTLEHLTLQQHHSVLMVGSQAFYPLYKLKSLRIGKIQTQDMKTIFFDLRNSQLDTLGLYRIDFETMRKPMFEDVGQCPLNTLEIFSSSINLIDDSAFSDLQDLRELLVKESSIKTVHPNALMKLHALESLTLEGCSLDQMPSGVLDSLTNLQVLNLRRNMLQTLPAELFKYNGKLLHIDLSLNRLQTLPEGIFRLFPSTLYVNLSGNYFTCDCSLAWASFWVKSLGNTTNAEDFMCFAPIELRGKHLKDFNPICIPEYVWYILIVILGITILSIVVVLLYVYRWKIYYQWYLLLSKRKDTEVWENNPRFKYDAFVAYCERDFEWVIHELIPNLENNAGLPNVKLCVSDRDWDLGGSILDNVESSIQRSRRTICVISTNFLKSEWCKLEMSLAHMQLFSENRDVLVFIFLEKIPVERLSQHQKLRREMCKKSCLDWPGGETTAQKVFWEKLRSLIFKNPVVQQI
ncbi:UNVERIFIED_CONTAM: hypothetical protein FKN15_066679 [Acipenser sinensis]